MSRQRPLGEDSSDESTDAHENVHIPDNYEQMQAAEVIEILRDCTQTQLEQIRDFEKAHEARQSVLRAIEQQFNQ